MTDSDRSYSGTLVAAILLAVMVAGIAYRYWPSDERSIRRHLSNLAEALSFPLAESTEERITRLAVLREYFDPNVRVKLDDRDLTSSRDEIIELLSRFQAPPGGVNVEFVDILVHLADDHETATVTLTAKMSSTNDKGVSMLEERLADVSMKNADGDWVIASAVLRPVERLAVFRFFLYQLGDAHDFVVALDVDQLHALGGAANRSNIVGQRAEDHPLLGDEQELIAGLDIGDPHHQSVPVGG